MSPTRIEMIEQLASSYLEEMSLRDLERYYYDSQYEKLDCYDDAELLAEFHQVLGG